MESLQKLELSEDEAFALLTLAVTSGVPLDSTSEKAVQKLAEYCKSHQRTHSNRQSMDCELKGAS